ncbi:hypothetical protein [Xanthomonas sp. D-109]|uniref:hypothetical protein n=1 Tax=Xanthomonas sp. D-109 TaxID=2821274 RepID=UPI001ADAA732|nr:hypothetical protein [Xanthomonas sp. D-109]MBO9881521.1 hypothetical protein [Xanthomonas sp. D-109]
MYDSKPTSIRDVVKAVEPIKNIERPYGDNEGDAINSPSVFPALPPDQQAVVENAEETLRRYIDQSQSASRAITEMRKKGLRAYFNPSDDDPYHMVGAVTVGDWTIDISDFTQTELE